jgi:acyl-CoA synthetase (AMP-forming)/AMP-acid ligase II
MSGALAELMVRALPELRWDIASVSDPALSPADVLAIGQRVEQALQARIAPAEPVIVRIGNRPSDLGSLLGAWQAGAVAVPLHVNAAPSTGAALIKATGARCLIDIDRLETCGTAPPPERPLLRNAALVIFTSGSTGQPKGAVIGHRRLADKLAVLDRLLRFKADDVVLVPLQLTFIFGLWVVLLALQAGSKPLLVPRFTADALLRGLDAGATVLGGVPSMYRTALADPAFSAPDLRMILAGGEVLPKPLAIAMQATSPRAEIFDLYGLTETGSCDFVLKPADQPDGLGTIGVPTEGVSYRIGDDGELQVRTPFGMLGYLDNQVQTADSFRGDYFRTGDLARARPDGRVELIGRAKDIVSRGGIKIAPLEIDNLLCEHPAVAAALCAGVPDERLGETIHAAIVRRAGLQVDEAELRTFLLARTERFKIPDVFYFCDVLPAGATGKADRRAVAQLANRKA